jgi:hypothetical protein
LFEYDNRILCIMNKRKELLENEVCSIVRGEERGEERGGGGEGGGRRGKDDRYERKGLDIA